ncbi:MAG TPA: tyrosine-protein phosphatase [Isosphaeraceae bacterium]|nr:tyrosine-protein phosphatase [Isosphaeraceae bacterium]
MDEQECRHVKTPRSARTLRRFAYLVLLLIAVPLVWIFRGPIGFANFGVVHETRVYRCAQPGDDLEATARDLKIRSILNLRGGSQDDEFYRSEVQVADRLNLDFYDLPMSATQRPSRTDLLRLLDILDHCRYPLLIHCKSGADRTGLATSLYRLQIQGQNPEKAEEGFSLAYGHIPFFGPDQLHEPLHEYQQWLQSQNLTHSPSRFRSWVTWDYADGDPPGALERPMQPGPRARLARAQSEKKGQPHSDGQRR